MWFGLGDYCQGENQVKPFSGNYPPTPDDFWLGTGQQNDAFRRSLSLSGALQAVWKRSEAKVPRSFGSSVRGESAQAQPCGL